MSTPWQLVAQGAANDTVGEGCWKVRQQLSPRLTQTLDLLMQGHSEKQVAASLGISVHTAHVYVKSLYRRYAVCSRSELLASAFRERYAPKEQGA